MTRADAVAELRRCAGTQFDPQVVDVLVAVLAAGTAALTERSDPPRRVVSASLVGDGAGHGRRRRLQSDSARSGPGAFFCARNRWKEHDGSVIETAGAAAELRQRVLREASEAEIKFVRLWFTDVVGPAEELRDHP